MMNTRAHLRKVVSSSRAGHALLSYCVLLTTLWSGCAGPVRTREQVDGESTSAPAGVATDAATSAAVERPPVGAVTRAVASESEVAPPEQPVRELESRADRDVAGLEEQWGLRILGLRLTAVDRMLDLRYRVVDAEKALPVFSRQEKPILIDEATGATLVVPSPPKLGPMRTSDKPIVDRNFFILFGNPGGFVKRGNLVSVVVGDFKAEHLEVQ